MTSIVLTLIEEVKASNGRTGKLWYNPKSIVFAVEIVEIGHSSGPLRILMDDIQEAEARDIFAELCNQYGIDL